MRHTEKMIILLAVAMFAALAMLMLPSRALSGPLPDRHPIEVDHGRCSECHEQGKFNVEHRATWYDEHRYWAAQSDALCSLCHAKAFCADCHAGKEELKPSEKFADEPKRNMPHRGDYITRHKIDGKIDPARCFRCHGRANNGKCKLCHR